MIGCQSHFNRCPGVFRELRSATSVERNDKMK
jgi:hypothetical protein